MENAKNLLYNGASELGITLSDKNIDDFTTYYNMLIDWNEKINLTAITKPEEVAVKHFVDSLTLLKYVDIKPNSTLIDVGTGAGFPSIPLGIIRKDIKITLLDSLKKRLIFLKEVSDALGINCNIVHARAEQAGVNPDYREKFDIATSRAVASLNVLSEYCLPLVSVGGIFIAMKGLNIKDEIDNSFNAIQTLGGKIKSVSEFNLIDKSTRNIVVINKISKTVDKYPRQGVKISKKPL